MRTDPRYADVDAGRQEADHPDLDDFVSYEDGDGLVICDRTDPRVWIRSDASTTPEP